MDLEEWEVLPKEISLHTYDDGGRRLFYSRIYNIGNPNSDIYLNYFAASSSEKSPSLGDQTGDELVRTLTVREVVVETVETDQETVSKENQFDDMKSEYRNLSDSGIYPDIDDNVLELMGESEANRSEMIKDENDCANKSEVKTVSNKTSVRSKTEVIWEEKSEGMNIWKRSLSGVGAIFSFGVAAATFCIVVLGNHSGQKQLHPHNQKIQFQFCSNEKIVKQVVNNTAILDEAFSSTKSVLRRAHITIGGY